MMNISCMAMQGNMSRQVRGMVVKVGPDEINEVMVAENIDKLVVLFISIFLVIFIIVVFTVICIKLRKRKAYLNDIKFANDDVEHVMKILKK